MARNPSNTAKPSPPKPKDRDPVASGSRDAAQNRVASHNYFFLEKYEAGVALRGTEVKSIREGKANLRDAYGLIKDGEAFLLNAHIGAYSHGSSNNHEALRTRKLLLHQEEIRKLTGKTQQSPWPAASRIGTSVKPSAAARPTRKPAPRLRGAGKPEIGVGFPECR
jgi:SsrA-binding protein